MALECGLFVAKLGALPAQPPRYLVLRQEVAVSDSGWSDNDFTFPCNGKTRTRTQEWDYLYFLGVSLGSVPQNHDYWWKYFRPWLVENYGETSPAGGAWEEYDWSSETGQALESAFISGELVAVNDTHWKPTTPDGVVRVTEQQEESCWITYSDEGIPAQHYSLTKTRTGEPELFYEGQAGSSYGPHTAQQTRVTVSGEWPEGSAAVLTLDGNETRLAVAAGEANATLAERIKTALHGRWITGVRSGSAVTFTAYRAGLAFTLTAAAEVPEDTENPTAAITVETVQANVLARGPLELIPPPDENSPNEIRLRVVDSTLTDDGPLAISGHRSAALGWSGIPTPYWIVYDNNRSVAVLAAPME